MPTWNIEAKDDVPIYDVCASFGGGQVSNTRANLLKADEVAEMVNYDIALTGELITRAGTLKVGLKPGGTGTFIRGLFYWDTPAVGKTYPVAVTQMAGVGSAYGYDGNLWNAMNTWAITSGTSFVPLVQGIDILYGVDGGGHMFSWNGAVWTDMGTGGAVPSNPPNFVTTIVWFTSRLIASGILSQPDTVYFSYPLDGAKWDYTLMSLRVGGGESDVITGLVGWTNFNLVVLKKRSVWVINCDPSLIVASGVSAGSIAAFTINPMSKMIGCEAPRTAVQVGNDIIALTTHGVRSLQRTIASETRSELGQALSYPVQDIIARINPGAIATSHATFWNNRYIMAIPLDVATSPNYLLVYNTITQTWSGLWTGLNVTCFSVRGVTGAATRLFMGLSNGVVVDFLDYVTITAQTAATFTDDGALIPTRLKTRALNFNEPASPKTGLGAEFEFNLSVADVTAQAILDGAVPVTYETIPTGSAALILPVTLPWTFPSDGYQRQAYDLMRFKQFRELQFLLTTLGGKVVVRGISASAFVDTVMVQSNTAIINAPGGS